MKRFTLTLIMLLIALCSYAQSGRLVYGCVYDRYLTPIKGAKISTINGELICETDENGQFNTQTSSYITHIVISHNDFESSKKSVDGSYMIIKLLPDSQKYTSILNSKWGIGLRVGGLSLVNVVGSYNLTSNNDIELRLGIQPGWPGIETDFTALYKWRIVEAVWTPNIGRSFIDLGAGINVGGLYRNYHLGAAIMARIGVDFKNIPISLSFDYTPSLGCDSWWCRYCGSQHEEFNALGLINFGVTCTYNF